jgi:N-carbamoylputrescine amidase
MSKVKLAVVQMTCTDKLNENVKKATGKVKEAAKKGAKIILLQELFENLYFCQVEDEAYFKTANPVHQHPFLGKFQELAKDLNVVLPVSFFEKAGQAH